MSASNLAHQTPDALKTAERLVESVGLPPRPQVVVDMQLELLDIMPDFDKVAELVASDPALAAKVLKLANSAFYGLPRPVATIKQALNVLGIDTLSNVVVSVALKESLEARDDPLNEKFWSHSLMVARTAELIARQVLFMPEFANHAYLAGLFHDCAIPLFRKKFRDYDELAVGLFGHDGEAVREEERRYDTDHSVVGYLVAKFWHLPGAVCEAIWLHHDPDLSIHSDPVARTIKAVLQLAEYISLSDGILTDRVEPLEVWGATYQPALAELKLQLHDVQDLREDALSQFGGL